MAELDLFLDAITRIAAIAGVLIASAAWYSAFSASKASVLPVLMRCLEQYSSAEMLASIIELRKWKTLHGDAFASAFGEARRINYEQVSALDNSRRRVSHYFRNLYLMYDARFLYSRHLKNIVSLDQIGLLFEIIEPLERAVNPQYRTEMFETYRTIFGSERISRALAEKTKAFRE